MAVVDLRFTDIGYPEPTFQQSPYSTGILAKNQTVLEIAGLSQSLFPVGGKGVGDKDRLQAMTRPVLESQD